MKVASLILAMAICLPAISQKKSNTDESKTEVNSSLVSGLKFRNIGPALMSGRISDIAVNPNNHDEWIITIASGGAFKTSNHGTTFEPIFDNQESYSVGAITMAPSNPNTIWMGSGENNNQRSVAYGDGVYKSLDGGKSWKNMGLKTSEHIGNIIVHPTNEDIVWVAAYGPLWSEGGERGVYKTTDGGKTWKQTLFISKHTGIAEIAIDPKNPDILYASAHQRRRHVYTYIGGGPESGLHKSTDGGETWREINSGLPSGDMGRVGITVSPADENYVYAIVEARNGKNGFYRSTNKGESWSKMSSYSTSGNYYQEIIADPYNKDKVFSMNTWLHHTENGGKNFERTGEKQKHVDNHCIWIDPNNTDHWLVGCDGGLYETYNHAKDWKFFPNLPITQFYKVAVDNAEPFYNIYGGTQDNNSLGGPSATINNAGILNRDWFITNGGDGFESAIDPVNPNIVYAQSQYGWLVRYDKQSGEKMGIQPMPERDEKAYRWNWDAPLLISPHDNKTLYFAANKLFKSTDRGNSWVTISPDLTQQIDRNKLPVMGQVWPKDVVMKNKSTTIYGNIVALDESPVKKGLIYVGTDDGLIQISADDGKTWEKKGEFTGIPKNTYVNMLIASPHDENVVFAIFNNHKNGDFKPYVMKSTNMGSTWVNISNNLPERGSAFCLKQDHVDPKLLFVGTEFGVFFSNDAGANWTQMKSGIPTIAIRDMDIQKRENDLVLASFGRGFYVLDDYSPLRNISKENLDKKSYLFPVKDALLYVPSAPLGGRGNGSQGGELYAAENPKYGANFTFYLKESHTSLKDKRTKVEDKLEKDGEDVEFPSLDDLRKENAEDKPEIIWIIKEANGREIHKMTTSPKKGISRVNWNLRLESTNPIKLSSGKVGRYSNPDVGPLVSPGVYSIEAYWIKDGELEQLVEKQNFNVKLLPTQTLPADDKEEFLAFGKEVLELNRSISGTSRLVGEYKEKLKYIKHTIKSYPNIDLTMLKQVEAIENKFDEQEMKLWGDGLKSSLDMETEPSISGRVGTVEYQRYGTTSAPTQTQKRAIKIASDDFRTVKTALNSIFTEIEALELKLQDQGAPYLKGGNKDWKED